MCTTLRGWWGLGDLMAFASFPLPALKLADWTPTVPAAIDSLSPPRVDEADFTLEDAEDLLCPPCDTRINSWHHPYHSFAATVQAVYYPGGP